jgi:hypothetical protein
MLSPAARLPAPLALLVHLRLPLALLQPLHASQLLLLPEILHAPVAPLAVQVSVLLEVLLRSR